MCLVNMWEELIHSIHDAGNDCLQELSEASNSVWMGGMVLHDVEEVNQSHCGRFFLLLGSRNEDGGLGYRNLANAKIVYWYGHMLGEGTFISFHRQWTLLSPVNR